MTLAHHADELVRLVRAIGKVDAHGNVHAPPGMGEMSGRFVPKGLGDIGDAILDALGADRRPGARRMTDAEFADRQERLERAVSGSYDDLATHVQHAIGNGYGAWKPERDAVHREIATGIYRDAIARGVPAEGRAIIAGGLGGAGKTTVLRDHADIDLERFLTINSDEVKEVLAERGMIPEIPGHPDLSPMERSVLAHIESSRIAGLVADMAYRDRRNIIWDTTMGDPNWARGLVGKLRGHGYDEVGSVFVDIPVEVSVQRALDRYRQGQDEYAAGKGLGGRYVQPSYIMAQRTPNGGTVNREGFDRLRDEFDSWSLFDNSVFGRPPVLVAKGVRHGKRGRGSGPAGGWSDHDRRRGGRFPGADLAGDGTRHARGRSARFRDPDGRTGLVGDGEHGLAPDIGSVQPARRRVPEGNRALARVVDANGNIHAPPGLGKLSGRFIEKALGDGGGEARARAPMTDAEFDARREIVDRAVKDAFPTLNTAVTHSDGHGVWTPERDAIHREIAAGIYARARDVPRDGKAIMAGGPPGAGKTTVLRDYAGVDTSDYFTISPDDMKEELARRGLVPDIPGLSPMERSVLVHAESQRIGMLIADLAYRDHRNIIWDASMSTPEWVDTVTNDLRAHDYGDVRAVFVDIPPEVSIERALFRYRRAQDEYAVEGKGLGGRYLPPRVIEALKTPDGGTKNRQIFEAFRNRFDQWAIFDNSTYGQKPRLLAESTELLDTIRSALSPLWREGWLNGVARA